MNWQGLADRTLRTTIRTFGEAVVYTPAGGAPVTLVGVFSSSHQQVDAQTGAAVTSQRPTLGIRLADLAAAPARNDQVVVRGTTYRVIDSEKDEEGGTMLVLQLA